MTPRKMHRKSNVVVPVSAFPLMLYIYIYSSVGSLQIMFVKKKFSFVKHIKKIPFYDLVYRPCNEPSRISF